LSLHVVVNGDVDFDCILDLVRRPSVRLHSSSRMTKEGQTSRSTMGSTSTSPSISKLRVDVDVKINDVRCVVQLSQYSTRA